MHSEKSVIFSTTGSDLVPQDTGSITSRRSNRIQSLRSKSNLKASQSTTSSKRACKCLRDSSSSYRSSYALGPDGRIQEISCAEVGPDIYRNVLGPTPDETVLAGLQTVIDLCTIAYPRLNSSFPSRSNRDSLSSGRSSGRRSTFASPERSVGSFKGSGGSASLSSPHESEEDLNYPDITESLVSAEKAKEIVGPYKDDYENVFDTYSEKNDLSSEQPGTSQEIIRDIQSYPKSQEAADDLAPRKNKSVWIYAATIGCIVVMHYYLQAASNSRRSNIPVATSAPRVSIMLDSNIKYCHITST